MDAHLYGAVDAPEAALPVRRPYVRRRAAAARRYLVNLGVPEDQMTIVSYGELRPLRRDNNDAAWAMNRRAQFAPIE